VVLIPRVDRTQRRCRTCLERYTAAFERNRRQPGKIEALVLERNQLREQSRPLRESCQRMADDYQTSAGHHPIHVLVPLEAFEDMRKALTSTPVDETR
jgi:hypothetical protein